MNTFILRHKSQIVKSVMSTIDYFKSLDFTLGSFKFRVMLQKNNSINLNRSYPSRSENAWTLMVRESGVFVRSPYIFDLIDIKSNKFSVLFNSAIREALIPDIIISKYLTSLSR